MNIHVSFCNQTTFTKCTTQKVLENVIVLRHFQLTCRNSSKQKCETNKKQIVSNCQTYKANDIKLFNLSRVFFFSLDNVHVIINYLVNPKFSFCFHYAIK